jgi:hypothetical protein
MEKINQLAQHKYYECSDLPFLGRIGIYSCHACDHWRGRALSRGFLKTSQRRDFLNDRFQCTRAKKGFGPIRVRIIYNGGRTSSDTLPASQITSKSAVENHLHQSSASRKKVSVKRKRAEEVVLRLQCTRKANIAKEYTAIIDKLEKDKRAMEIRRKLEDRKNMELKSQLEVKEMQLGSLQGQLIAKQLHLESATCNLQMIEEKIKIASNSLAEWNKKLKGKKALAKYHDNKEAASSTTKNCEAGTLCNAIEKAFTCLKGKHATTKARMMMEALMSGKVLNGEATVAFQGVVKQYIRSLFRPWKLVKAGDMAAVGGFKTTTINALRNIIDENGEGFFPSATTVNRSRALLDQYGSKVIGYHRRDTQYGEVYFLNFEPAFRMLLKACNLHELAQKESVKVALSVDGADLFKGRTHVSTGIKITDERGLHPITRQPFLVAARENDDDDMFAKIQTKEVCCVMIIADAKDNKHLYEDVFKEYYDWGEMLRREGLAASQFGPKLMPFTITHTPDLKGAWFLTNRGGGCKNKNFFCHLCTCTKSTLTSYVVDNMRCDRCKKRNKHKCYHSKVCDSVSVPKMLEELTQHLGEYYTKYGKTYEDILAVSKLRVDHSQADKENDINHIDYVIPTNDAQKKRLYTQFIARECTLRGLQLHGAHVEEWRNLLRSSIEMEKYIAVLQKVKEWDAQGRETVPLVEVVELIIPCILHLENRVGEKIITIILRRALDDFHGRKDDFIERMNAVFKRKLLGSDLSPSQWKLPVTKEAEQIKIDHIQVRNNIARCIVKDIEVVIEAAWPPERIDFQTQLIDCISNYRKAMELLTLHRELTKEECDQFQDHIDDFYEIWINIFGDEGITNYIHMLGSGHIYYFLKKYGCLYLYSQQGWEALNNTIQTFIHQSSQRGGFGSGDGNRKSYIFPLVRMIVRDLLWKTYEADKFFIRLEEEGKAC